MAMKSEWRVSHTYAGGKMFRQVYRLRDVDEVDHGGNREYYGRVYATDEEAQAVADALNKAEKE